MGTGVLSTLLHQLPYNEIWLYWLSVILFVLNLILFIIAISFSILRYVMYPATWKAMLKHPVQPFALAMMPMAFATLINMTVYVCVPIWGHLFVLISWIMWWVDVVASGAICFFLTFEM
jgi:tellurite resistance protein TehA-like permease